MRRLKKGEAKDLEQAVMGDLDLDTVEAGIDEVARTPSEAVDDRTDIVFVQGLGAEMAVRLWHLGRSPENVRRVLQRSVAGMGQLAEDLGAVGVNRIGDPAVMRNDRRVPGVDEPAGHFARRVDRLAFEDDQRGATPRPFLVVGGVIVGGHAVGVTEGGEMRLENETIA